MNMVEKVARAMRMADTDAKVGALWEPGERATYEAAWDDAPPYSEEAEYNYERMKIREKWLGRARAALEAMKAPTQSMLDTSYRDDALGPGAYLHIWQTMLDAALS